MTYVCYVQSPLDEKAAIKEIHDAVKQNYELINSAFCFYPTGTSADVFHMGLNNFTAMLEDCKVSAIVVIPQSDKVSNLASACMVDTLLCHHTCLCKPLLSGTASAACKQHDPG